MDNSEPIIDSRRYINRDEDWLDFNELVLKEASDTNLPLYERIKFIAIFSSNMDEYFRIRVAALHKVATLKKARTTEWLGFDIEELLIRIYKRVYQQQEELGILWQNVILKELAENNIVLCKINLIQPDQLKKLNALFHSYIQAYLQVTIRSMRDTRPFIMENNAAYLAVTLIQIQNGKSYLGYINIPSPAVPRFFHFETRENIYYIIWLDDILRLHLDDIFPGYTVHDCYSIKLNRDEDYEIEDEFDGDLVKKIKDKLSKRGKSSEPIRLLYDKTIPEKVLKQVIKNCGLKGFEGIPGGRYHNMNELFQFPNPVGEKLTAHLPAPLPHSGLEHGSSIFQSIEEKDQLLYFPYHSYDYVLRFFNEAVTDPMVEEIKVVLYRIDKNSTIAHALINAAKNGKKVMAFVEIKARYDELNNLYWGDEMQKAGVHIIYSMPGIKVHSKIALIIKNDGNGKKKKYAYLSTGNFNEKTATIYSDFGLFTTNNYIIREIKAIFKFLSTGKNPGPLNLLLVAPYNMKKEIIKLIDNEIKAAADGKPSGIILKVNGLDEKELIEKLYEASAAGVTIKIIVRAGCSLIPGKKGLSENISAYRLVGKYLEHARVLYFKAQGKEKIFLSSADWMNRNLSRRIEVGFPVYDETFKKDIRKFLEIQLSPDVKKTAIQQNAFTQLPGKDNRVLEAQDLIYEWIKQKS